MTGSRNVEQCITWCWKWNMPFNMFKLVESCWKKIELSSILFNKLRLFKGFNPSFLSFVSSGFADINMASEKFESAVFEWTFDNSRSMRSICAIEGWQKPWHEKQSSGRDCSKFLSAANRVCCKYYPFTRPHFAVFWSFFSTLHNNGDIAKNDKAAATFPRRLLNFAPKCVVVAQQKLNKYSTSCNHVSTSRNNVEHWLINKSSTALKRASFLSTTRKIWFSDNQLWPQRIVWAKNKKI